MAVWLAVGLWLCLGCRCAVVPSGPVCRCTKARECRDGLRGPRTNPCILDTDYLRKAFWWTRARRSPSSSGRRRRCDVRRFTRLANYFRRFVEGYAKVAEVNPTDPLSRRGFAAPRRPRAVDGRPGPRESAGALLAPRSRHTRAHRPRSKPKGGAFQVRCGLLCRRGQVPPAAGWVRRRSATAVTARAGGTLGAPRVQDRW